MAGKNGNGEGSRPCERADGWWEARYWVGGKRHSVYGSTRKEAADKLAKAIAYDEDPHTTPHSQSCIFIQRGYKLHQTGESGGP